ncbi:MAG: hypothetical protein FWG38_01490, partial [Defluviitaleaceae bacterium]|nr:hypothetical protein [Defluviitaleaceae bacterium]
KTPCLSFICAVYTVLSNGIKTLKMPIGSTHQRQGMRDVFYFYLVYVRRKRRKVFTCKCGYVLHFKHLPINNPVGPLYNFRRVSATKISLSSIHYLWYIG